jgi:hypothetical protein
MSVSEWHVRPNTFYNTNSVSELEMSFQPHVVGHVLSGIAGTVCRNTSIIFSPSAALSSQATLHNRQGWVFIDLEFFRRCDRLSDLVSAFYHRLSGSSVAEEMIESLIKSCAEELLFHALVRSGRFDLLPAVPDVRACGWLTTLPQAEYYCVGASYVLAHELNHIRQLNGDDRVQTFYEEYLVGDGPRDAFNWASPFVFDAWREVAFHHGLVVPRTNHEIGDFVRNSSHVMPELHADVEGFAAGFAMAGHLEMKFWDSWIALTTALVCQTILETLKWGLKDVSEATAEHCLDRRSVEHLAMRQISVCALFGTILIGQLAAAERERATEILKNVMHAARLTSISVVRRALCVASSHSGTLGQNPSAGNIRAAMLEKGYLARKVSMMVVHLGDDGRPVSLRRSDSGA